MSRALGYGDVGEYRELAAGSYAVGVRPAGASPATAPALSARVQVPAGGARTLALSGVFADLALTPLPDDDLTPPANGAARVRVVAAAAGGPALDAGLDGGPVLARALPFPAASGWTAVPAGPATLRLETPTGTTTVPVDLAAGTVVTLLVLDGPGGGLTARAVLDAAAPAVVPVGAAPAGAGDAVAGATDPPGPPQAGVSAPVRVRAPAADLDAPLTGSGLDAAGVLSVPDASVAGWYTGGPVPGQRGPAVLAGHVDWAGRPAVFGGLHRLSPGDEVVVDRADGSQARFAVVRVVQVAKDAFPTGDVYGPVPGSELRLITCGGRLDRSTGSYTDNVVVFARLVH